MYVKSCKYPHVLMYIFNDGREDTINTFVTAITKQLTEAAKQWFMLDYSLRGTLHRSERAFQHVSEKACHSLLQSGGRERDGEREGRRGRK